MALRTIWFWRSWSPPYRRIGFFLGLLFLSSLIFLAYSYTCYPALSWDYIQELEVDEIPVHAFSQGPFELAVRGDNYLVFEYLLGQPIPLHAGWGYLLLGVLFSCIAVMLAVVTLLKRFWYYLGMGFFILFIVTLQVDALQVFEAGGRTLTVWVLGVYMAVSFYWYAFRAKASFSTRVIVFFMITVLLAGAAAALAERPKPLLYLAVSCIPAAAAIAITFICMVAHEIIASFVYMASHSGYGGKSLRHLAAISVVYMANLVLIYTHRIGMVEWPFAYVHPLLLLTISGILGIWGFRKREPQYAHIMPADPFGVYLILCMGAVCFVAIGYFLGTGNDAPLATMENIILYSHIGYGLIFLVYIFSNFIAMLARDMPVYKVLYRPNSMPYFTFRFGGLVATLAFVFYNTWQKPINNVLAGMYNARADYYRHTGRVSLASSFYHQAATYGFLNHHANYGIAQDRARNYDPLQERNFYQRASQRRPTEFSYVNLSHTFQREQNWHQMLSTLHAAKARFPASGAIENALGIAYENMHLFDSALYFFDRSMERKQTAAVAKTNFIATLARQRAFATTDSLLASVALDSDATRSNALAMANREKVNAGWSVDARRYGELNVFSASLINNYMINRLVVGPSQPEKVDTAFVAEAIALSRDSANRSFAESLQFTAALSLYKAGHVWKAFRLLEEVASFGERQGRYNTVLALWALEQRDPRGALRAMDYALRQEYADAGVATAVALLESRQLDEAAALWSDIGKQDSSYQELAAQIVAVLTASPSQIDTLTDEEKYMYCRYRIDPLDTAQWDYVLTRIDDIDLRARICFEMSVKLFENDRIDLSIGALRKIEGMLMSDRALYRTVADFEMELLARQGNLETLDERLRARDASDSAASLPPLAQRLYYRALFAERSADSVRAYADYTALAKRNPYHEEAIIASARYLGRHEGPLAAYTVLADALQYNPYAIKLLKAYSVSAARMGFNEYAISALERLQDLASARVMQLFLAQNSDVFSDLLPEALN